MAPSGAGQDDTPRGGSSTSRTTVWRGAGAVADRIWRPGAQSVGHCGKIGLPATRANTTASSRGSGRTSDQTMRRAFTLFEIAISLALTTTAVVVALGLFPAGVRAQQMARFRLYA